MTGVILVEAAETFTHVSVWGRLDAAGVATIEHKLIGQTVARDRPAVVDLDEVTFIASLGVGMLVQLAGTMRKHGLPVVILVGASPVRDVLDMLHIGALIPIVATRDEALAALGVA